MLGATDVAKSVMNWVPLSPTNPPTARQQHAMAYDAAHKQVVLFGGRDT